MDFWCETVVVAPDGGMCKQQILASRGHVRHNGERIPATVLAPVSIWFIVIMLKPVTYTSKKQSYMFMVIGGWWLALTTSLLWTTNHSGAVAVTPSQPTLQRRFDVIMTLLLRHVPAGLFCPLRNMEGI